MKTKRDKNFKISNHFKLTQDDMNTIEWIREDLNLGTKTAVIKYVLGYFYKSKNKLEKF
jgi:hypothetical protein